MKNKLLLVIVIAGLMASLTACKSSAPANANIKATNTTTTTTTTTSTNTANTPANTNTTTNTTASNTSSTSNSSSPAQEAGKQDFTLVNATGVEIDKVFITPHSSNDWEDDILGQDTLPDGQSVDIKFHRNEKAALWDLRVEDKQGNSIEWENLNLLEISKVTLHYKNGKAWADTE